MRCFIYLMVFLSEFSSFFSLPLLGASSTISASNAALCMAGAVVLENILMFTITGCLEAFSRNKIIFVSLLLRGMAYLSIYISLALSSWLFFYFLISISKSISKPFLRDILVEGVSNTHLKRTMNTFSFCQNFAVFIGPTIATAALKYNFTGEVLIFLIILNLIFAFHVLFISHIPGKDKILSSKRAWFFITPFLKVSDNIKYVLLASFLSNLMMGVFITATTLVSKIKPEFTEYSGVFFSIVGATICLWQGIIATLIRATPQTLRLIMFVSGILSSVYLHGSLYITFIALIAYSIYESIIIPMIYYEIKQVNTDVSSAVLFGYITVLSNAGGAFGMWITGFVITHAVKYVTCFIFITILCSATLSYISMSGLNKNK